MESGAVAAEQRSTAAPERVSSVGTPAHSEGKTGAAAPSSPAPVLYYHWSDQGQKATIVTPAFELKTEIKAVIRRYGVLLDGDKLEDLKGELQMMGIALKRKI